MRPVGKGEQDLSSERAREHAIFCSFSVEAQPVPSVTAD